MWIVTPFCVHVYYVICMCIAEKKKKLNEERDEKVRKKLVLKPPKVCSSLVVRIYVSCTNIEYICCTCVSLYLLEHYDQFLQLMK